MKNPIRKESKARFYELAGVLHRDGAVWHAVQLARHRGVSSEKQFIKVLQAHNLPEERIAEERQRLRIHVLSLPSKSPRTCAYCTSRLGEDETETIGNPPISLCDDCCYNIAPTEIDLRHIIARRLANALCEWCEEPSYYNDHCDKCRADASITDAMVVAKADKNGRAKFCYARRAYRDPITQACTWCKARVGMECVPIPEKA